MNFGDTTGIVSKKMSLAVHSYKAFIYLVLPTLAAKNLTPFLPLSLKKEEGRVRNDA